jgi:hypothetical protein
VGLSLSIFAWLVFDGPVGQRIFRPDNLTETFKLIFTTMANEDDEQLRIIFLDLAEILLTKARGKKSFEDFGREVWDSSAGFPWCAANHPQVHLLLFKFTKVNSGKDFRNVTFVIKTRFVFGMRHSISNRIPSGEESVWFSHCVRRRMLLSLGEYQKGI